MFQFCVSHLKLCMVCNKKRLILSFSQIQAFRYNNFKHLYANYDGLGSLALASSVIRPSAVVRPSAVLVSL